MTTTQTLSSPIAPRLYIHYQAGEAICSSRLELDEAILRAALFEDSSPLELFILPGQIIIRSVSPQSPQPDDYPRDQK